MNISETDRQNIAQAVATSNTSGGVVRVKVEAFAHAVLWLHNNFKMASWVLEGGTVRVWGGIEGDSSWMLRLTLED